MSWLLCLAAGVLTFIASWTVIPGPAIWLVAIGVGGAELSPVFLVASLIVGGLVWRAGGGPRPYSMALTLIAVVIFAVPIARYPSDAPISIRRLVVGLEDTHARITRGVAIDGTATPLTLDIYQPTSLRSSPEPHPILVQIYGGAWQRGAPGDDAAFAATIADRGYVVFAIDYRHAPDAIWPAQIDDVRASLSWIRRHAAGYDADPSRIAVIGRSAGAELAMVAGFTDPGVRAVISYYGPVNLANGWREPPSPDPIGARPVLEAYLGGRPDQVADRYAAASPITHVSSHAPPTLLIYGARDHIVQATFGRALHAALTAAGASAQYVEIPWADHAFDAIPGGLGGQLSLWRTEQFLGAVLTR